MGSLSNLYISQSYQSLIHLATDTALVSGTMTELQDGLGNPLNLFFDGTNISSSGNIFAANVGGGSDISKLNAFTASQYVSNSFFATTGSNTFRGNQDIIGSVTASTLRVDGLNYPIADNGAKSFMQTDGAGNLSLQYVDTIWEIVRAGQTVTKGTPLYISGSQGANPIVYAADAANPAKMPVTYVAGQNMTAGTNYNAIVLGLIEGINLTGYTTGQTIYVAEGGGFTSNLPSGSNSITQVLGVVTKDGAGGKALVLNPGPAQLPGLQTGFAWVGNGNNRAVAVSTSSFAGGGTINTASFATTGSNIFRGDQTITGSLNISSSNAITFNVPNPGFMQNGFTVNGNFGVNGDVLFSQALRMDNLFANTITSRSTGRIELRNNVLLSTNVPGSNADLTISGSLFISGAASITSVLTLGQLNPLPAGTDGQLAVSASNLYFFSGSAWNKVAFG